MKISVMLLLQIYKLILKFILKCKGAKIDKMILEKMNKAGVLTAPDFETYHKAIVVNRVWH